MGRSGKLIKRANREVFGSVSARKRISSLVVQEAVTNVPMGEVVRLIFLEDQAVTNENTTLLRWNVMDHMAHFRHARY